MNLLKRAEDATQGEFASDYGVADLQRLVAELAAELRGLAQAVSADISIMQVQLEAEFGSGRSLEELIAAGDIVATYTRAQELLKGIDDA